MRIFVAKKNNIGGPTPLDAYLTVNLLKEMNSNLPILEVGVFTGGFIICHLRNNENLIAVGVDPFPGLENFREELFSNLEIYRIRDRYVHYDSIDEIKNESSKFSLIHLDGEHSESALSKDLTIASQLIDRNGIIVVDDFFHLDFPGVSSAVYEFLHHNNFSSFLITQSKIYLCRENVYGQWLQKSKNIMDQIGIKYELEHKSVVAQGYQSSNAINGFKNIIVKLTPNEERELRIALGIESASSLSKYLKLMVKFIFPGGVFYTLRYVKSKIR